MLLCHTCIRTVLQTDAASSSVLKGLYESERNETKANPVFITQDAKRTNEYSPDG